MRPPGVPARGLRIAAVALLLGAGGCSLQAQREPEPIPPDRLPSSFVDRPVGTPTPDGSTG